MSDAEQAPARSAEGAAAPAPKKGGATGIVVIALVALLAAGGAGAGVYFFAGHKSDQSVAADDEEDAPADEEKPKQKEKDKKAKGKKAAKPKAPALYLALDPPFVVNFEAKGVMRFLQVSVQVMTRDPHTLDLLKANDPMIRNDLLMMLSNQNHDTISTVEGKEKMRAEALTIVANIIASEGGEGKHVEQLYFTSFVMQ